MSQPKEPPVQLEYARPAAREWDGIRMLALVLPPTVLISLGGLMVWIGIFGGKSSTDRNFFVAVVGTLFITVGMCYPLSRVASARQARRHDPLQKEPLPWSGPQGKASLVETMLKKK